MVENTALSTALIELIEAVAASEEQDFAIQALLRSLLEIFQMDQAALFEKNDQTFHCLTATDRTGRIIRSAKEVFSSTTLLEKSLLSMEPLNWRANVNDEATPASVKDDSLKRIVCLPLARTPATAIFIGSRMPTAQNFTDEDMKRFKTAARAAWLAIRQFKTQETLARTRHELKSLRDAKNSLLYSSQIMGTTIEIVERIAPFNISILLTGESGVGKEEVARHIHFKSQRRGAFIAINCANLSESLLESELFGYRKGAFTGAVQGKDGLFKAAHEGTLFLDEIAEIPVNLQAKLLRALQERRIRPVGATDDIEVDVRIVAATHQNLENSIAKGTFRADLYYRVQEFAINVPSLRARPEDIELLAEHFINRASQEMGLPRRVFGAETLSLLVKHSWPGNVRELKSVCRTAVILARNDEIQPTDLRINFTERVVNKIEASESPDVSSAVSASEVPDRGVLEETNRETNRAAHRAANRAAKSSQSLRDLSRYFERQLVRNLLGEGLSQVEVASRLGISVRTLHRILAGADEAASEDFPLEL